MMRSSLTNVIYFLLIVGIVILLAGFAFGADQQDDTAKARARAALALAPQPEAISIEKNGRTFNLQGDTLTETTKKKSACGIRGCDCGCGDGKDCSCAAAKKNDYGCTCGGHCPSGQIMAGQDGKYYCACGCYMTVKYGTKAKAILYPCSPACECGCNEGSVCRCGEARRPAARVLPSPSRPAPLFLASPPPPAPVYQPQPLPQSQYRQPYYAPQAYYAPRPYYAPRMPQYSAPRRGRASGC